MAGLSATPALAPSSRMRCDGAVQVRAGLGVDGDEVGAGLGEGFEEGVGGRDHQVHVERQCA